MRFEINSPANARYLNPAGTFIALDITIGGKTRQFNASPDDVVDYGREIYARAQAGEFGPVAPFVEPEQ